MASRDRGRGASGPRRSRRVDPALPVAPAKREEPPVSSPHATAGPRSELPEPGRPATRETFRSLLRRGLTPDEAANLTAVMVGIHVGEVHWRLCEINGLLFLRSLNEAGTFSGADDTAEERAL